MWGKGRGREREGYTNRERERGFRDRGERTGIWIEREGLRV